MNNKSRGGRWATVEEWSEWELRSYCEGCLPTDGNMQMLQVEQKEMFQKQDILNKVNKLMQGGSFMSLDVRYGDHVNNVGYYEHTNPLFYRSHVMKCNDLVDYKVMQTMYRAKEKSLPDFVQRLFSIHECKYDLRYVCKFTVQKAKQWI